MDSYSITTLRINQINQTGINEKGEWRQGKREMELAKELEFMNQVTFSLFHFTFQVQYSDKFDKLVVGQFEKSFP